MTALRWRIEEAGRAVEVEAEAGDGRWWLRSARTVLGDPADLGHLIGCAFVDVDGIERAVRAALRTDERDVLDRVLLTEEAVRQWQATCDRALREAAEEGWKPTEPIPDERAIVLPDGRLLIYVALPGRGRVTLALSQEQWSWRDGGSGEGTA